MATTRAQTGVCNIPNRSIFEGDNLDVMRGMNDGRVDLIYLDLLNIIFVFDDPRIFIRQLEQSGNPSRHL